MKRSILAVLALLGLPSLTYANEHYDFARVTSVEPVYSMVERRIPQEECWIETVRQEPGRQSNAAGTIAGGIVGGALGHAVGHGHKNKRVGTVVGAVLGMAVGSNVGRQHRAPRYEDVQRCETHYVSHTEERLNGYDVTYHYFGQYYTTRMDHPPGERIRVAVRVDPVGSH